MNLYVDIIKLSILQINIMKKRWRLYGYRRSYCHEPSPRSFSFGSTLPVGNHAIYTRTRPYNLSARSLLRARLDASQPQSAYIASPSVSYRKGASFFNSRLDPYHEPSLGCWKTATQEY
ncbi:hypothetical protein FGSG_04878 [Fusarium graminearum PH-1]|nr:hypothetical protein FGSG_04878 [Fusarium graminearum PH-1]ESU10768.1 hypothetical protein FGSG_04878 [Fusarium graminearum PH-1]|eukprot:XP_011323344.1 hypothetical protein FGSG_04878 [Fusarium graminearum PH-1]